MSYYYKHNTFNFHQFISQIFLITLLRFCDALGCSSWMWTEYFFLTSEILWVTSSQIRSSQTRIWDDVRKIFGSHSTSTPKCITKSQKGYGTSYSVPINYGWSYTSRNPWVLLLYLFWKWSLIKVNNIITFCNEFKNPSNKYGLNIFKSKFLTHHRSWWPLFEWIL